MKVPRSNYDVKHRTHKEKSLLIKREDKLLKRCPPKQIIRAETTSVSFTNVFRT